MVPRRILVTGAGGFVARHLWPRLQARFPEAELVAMGGAGRKVELDDPATAAAFLA